MSIDYEGNFDFQGLEDKLAAALPDALQAAGDFLGDRADLRTPVLVDLKRANQKRRADPGALRDSRFVRIEGNLSVAIGYSEFYAGWNHEKEYRHPVGERKWLEKTLAQDGEEALEKVADRLKEEL